ncbi:MAG: hypothetical protein ACI8TL_000502 [Natronomonas sp.]|jgi:hypothetical protein
MDRRAYLTAIGAAGLAATAGCSGGSDDGADSDESDVAMYDGEASSYLLSLERISETLPGEWARVGSREPDQDPNGLASIVIQQYSRTDSDGTLDFALTVFETVDDVETYLGDNRDVISADDGVTLTEQEVGEESFSVDTQNGTILYVRRSNIYIQLFSALPLSDLRALAQAQLNALD